MTELAGLIDVRDYFEIGASQFRQEWSKLSDTDKADLRSGIGNTSMTY